MRKLFFTVLSVATFVTLTAKNPTVIKTVQLKNKVFTFVKQTNEPTGPTEPIGPKNLYTLYAADCGGFVQFEAFSSLQASYILGQINFYCRSQKQHLLASIN